MTGRRAGDAAPRADAVAGWVVHDGDPGWRCTLRARDRAAGRRLSWGGIPRRCHVVSIDGGLAIAVVRRVPAFRTWSVRIEGFEFPGGYAVAGGHGHRPVATFASVRPALAFVRRVLAQAGAVVT